MALVDPPPNFILLGNFPDIDTTDTIGNTSNFSGNEAALVGQVFTGTTHSIQSVTLDDANNSFYINTNHDSFQPGSGDSINGSEIDTFLSIYVDVRLDATTVLSNARMLGIQTVNGDVYLANANNQLDNLTFSEIEINSVESTGQNSFLTLWYQNGARSIDNASFVCFAADARIATPAGEVSAGALRHGDIVTTRDHGPQRIRWVGRRHLDAEELDRAPHLRPVRIRTGALGRGLPRRDLLVSP